jgi:drug/metabolite transporter (DMT)-like permease
MADAASPSTSAPAPSATLPLLAAAASAASFIGMDAAVKLLAHRFGAGSLFAVPLWLWFRPALPSRASWPLHGLRCALLLLALVTYFHALTVLPLVQAVAVGYTAPIFISLLAIVVLRERPSRWIWLALSLGMAGVGVSLWPEFSRTHLPGGVLGAVLLGGGDPGAAPGAA